MTKREELDLFLLRADEFIASKYILADIKIVNLLKAIASSETLVAIFKNCLDDFDYFSASKKYLVKSPYLASDKGEFILPPSSRELLAFVFNLLMDLDTKTVVLGDFIDKYFFVDGSFSAGYDAFMNKMIKPFRNAVKVLMESVIEGKVQDPIEALTEQETRRAKELEMEKQNADKERELAQKSYGEKVKKVKEILLSDKSKVKESRLSESKKEDAILVIDMLANVIDSLEKDALIYAFTAYKYMASCHKVIFFNGIKKMSKLVMGIVDEL